jgi:hypothetical protein
MIVADASKSAVMALRARGVLGGRSVAHTDDSMWVYPQLEVAPRERQRYRLA